ncbi:MAG: hypothetical protein ACLP3Q_14965 [Streptosporangiaceae bacterium]
MIGLPWYLTGHLPGILFVAHEAGHHIEDDGALTAAVSGRLAVSGLPGPSQARWQPWLGEVFADAVASITCGVVYPAVLADALAAAPPGGAAAASYPPPRVRVQVCRAAVRQAGLPPDAPGVAWDDLPGEPDAAEAEPPAAVRAILDEPYAELGGQTLGVVLASPAVAGAEEGAPRLLAGVSSGRLDVRAAAAALAFIRSPEDYDRLQVGESAIREVLSQRPVGPRLGPTSRPAAPATRRQAARSQPCSSAEYRPPSTAAGHAGRRRCWPLVAGDGLPTSPRSGSPASRSSAASSTNTSGPHESPGQQGKWHDHGIPRGL